MSVALSSARSADASARASATARYRRCTSACSEPHEAQGGTSWPQRAHAADGVGCSSSQSVSDADGGPNAATKAEPPYPAVPPDAATAVAPGPATDVVPRLAAAPAAAPAQSATRERPSSRCRHAPCAARDDADAVSPTSDEPPPPSVRTEPGRSADGVAALV